MVIFKWVWDGDVWCCEDGFKVVFEIDFEFIYLVVVWGLRDYVEKNWFLGVVFGMFGGIDSVLSVVIVVDVLGLEKVYCVMMLLKYMSLESFDDVVGCFEFLGVWYDIIFIVDVVVFYDGMFKSVFEGIKLDMIEENI